MEVTDHLLFLWKTIQVLRVFGLNFILQSKANKMPVCIRIFMCKKWRQFLIVTVSTSTKLKKKLKKKLVAVHKDNKKSKDLVWFFLKKWVVMNKCGRIELTAVRRSMEWHQASIFPISWYIIKKIQSNYSGTAKMNFLISPSPQLYMSRP